MDRNIHYHCFNFLYLLIGQAIKTVTYHGCGTETTDANRMMHESGERDAGQGKVRGQGVL